MKIVKGLKKIKSKKPLFVAIGTFDGVHLAHKKVIKTAAKEARDNNGLSIVLTFYPHPMQITNPKNTPVLLTSIEHRVSLIRELNPDVCMVIDFKKSFANMSAQNFIKNVLANYLNVKCVIVGDNFSFGKNKSGNVRLLKKMASFCNYEVKTVKSVKRNNKIVSSSFIRSLIEKGKLSVASKLLGRRFSVLGSVIKGKGLGKKLGFPTANIDPHQEALPPKGVYAVTLKMRNRYYKGMLNIGKRPTFFDNSSGITIEAHIFNFNNNIYNRVIEIFFLQKIRSEKKFKSPDLLKRQLKRDFKKTKEILKGI